MECENCKLKIIKEIDDLKKEISELEDIRKNLRSKQALIVAEGNQSDIFEIKQLIDENVKLKNYKNEELKSKQNQLDNLDGFIKTIVSDGLNQSVIMMSDKSIDINFKNTELVDILNNEINCLIKKIEKAREGDNSGTYKNLIQSLVTVVNLRNEELSNDYKLMYSEYKTEVSGDNQGNVNYQKQVAVWEQNGDGLIRNHKVWNVQDNNMNGATWIDNGRPIN